MRRTSERLGRHDPLLGPSPYAATSNTHRNPSAHLAVTSPILVIAFFYSSFLQTSAGRTVLFDFQSPPCSPHFRPGLEVEFPIVPCLDKRIEKPHERAEAAHPLIVPKPWLGEG